MNRFSKLVLIAIFFSAVFIPVCFAENDNILSGRDLLRVVREKQGLSSRPVYADRTVKPAKPFVAADQNQAKVKSADDKLPILKDYKKDTRYSGAAVVSMPVARGRLTDITVQKPLEKTIVFSALPSEIPFEQAIDILRNSVNPPLNIVVLWRDLQNNADIDRATLVNIDGISSAPLGTALVLLLNSASADVQLGYTVENGVIVIATRQSLPKRMESRIYNVADLFSKPAAYQSKLGTRRSMGTQGGMQSGGGGFQTFGE